MKRAFSTLILLAMLIVSISASAPVAYADIPNKVISGPASEQQFAAEEASFVDAWYSVNGYPSWDDIVAIGDGDRITGPSAKYYLKEYQIKYVEATKGNRIYVYKTAERMTKNPETVEHGARVYVLAERGSASMIIYRDQKNQPTSGWVSTNLLSYVYPGTEVTLGSGHVDQAVYLGDIPTTWSGQKMAGTNCEYLLLDEPVSDCVSFTLEYRAEYKGAEDSSGSRDVYINNGEGWVYVGRFQYASSKSFHISILLDNPTTVYAIATPLVVERGKELSVRENILDVMVMR